MVFKGEFCQRGNFLDLYGLRIIDVDFIGLKCFTPRVSLPDHCKQSERQVDADWATGSHVTAEL